MADEEYYDEEFPEEKTATAVIEPKKEAVPVTNDEYGDYYDEEVPPEEDAEIKAVAEATQKKVETKPAEDDYGDYYDEEVPPEERKPAAETSPKKETAKPVAKVEDPMPADTTVASIT